MAANNNNNNNNNNNAAGRQNNGLTNADHVEFSVRAEEDLYLQGSEATIRRVTADTNYSCLMLKTQRFSSLFRHYAKYHGLRKDDLEYYFVNLLENEDTPESVQLQRGDTITVRKRRKQEIPEAASSDDDFFANMKELLDQEEHMDVVFQLFDNNNNNTCHKNPNHNIKTEFDENMDMMMETKAVVEVHAHKAVLMARTEYFRSMFSGEDGPQAVPSASLEEDEDEDVVEDEEEEVEHPQRLSSRPHSCPEPAVVRVDPEFTEHHVRLALEFIYTNRLVDIQDVSAEDLLALMKLSNKWILRDLKRLVEMELIRNHISSDTVARLYGAAELSSGKRLHEACLKFIMANLKALTSNVQFKEEMKTFPELCIPVLKAAADLIPEGPMHKKQRTDLQTGTPSSAIAAFRSSPVPDSDQ